MISYRQSVCVAFAVMLLGLFTIPTTAFARPMTEGWKFTDINKDFCQMYASYGGANLKIARAKKSGSPIRIHLGGALPKMSARGYPGSVSFDNNKVRIADAADATTDIFKQTLYRWEFSDLNILSDLKKRNSITVMLNGKSFGPFSLKGSGKVVQEFMDCAGLVVQPAKKSKPTYSFTEENLKLFERALWKDSRSWVFNRYVPNSIFQTELRELSDPSNYTARVYYKYNRNRTGFVDIDMVDGKVNCMRYHDNQFTCKRIYVR